MEKLVITIERTEKQVSIYSLEPSICIMRDVDKKGSATSDRAMLKAFANALDAQRENLNVPA